MASLPHYAGPYPIQRRFALQALLDQQRRLFAWTPQGDAGDLWGSNTAFARLAGCMSCITHDFQAVEMSAPCVCRKAAPVQLGVSGRVARRQHRLQDLTVALHEARAQARMPICDGSQRILRHTHGVARQPCPDSQCHGDAVGQAQPGRPA